MSKELSQPQPEVYKEDVRKRYNMDARFELTTTQPVAPLKPN
jgi:hypothetical protein